MGSRHEAEAAQTGIGVGRWLRRAGAAVGGGLLTLASLGEAASRQGKGADGHDKRAGRDEAKPTEERAREGGRDRAADQEGTERHAAAQRRPDDDPTRADRREARAERDERADRRVDREERADRDKAGDRDDRPGRDDAGDRGARRAESEQAAGDPDNAATRPDDAADGLADRLRERAEAFRARQDAPTTGEDAAGDDDLVDITVDLERSGQDAIDVDLNLPDLSSLSGLAALLDDLPNGAAVGDDISFARSGDSVAISGSGGTFAISNPDDDGGDPEVDFSS